MLKSSVMTSTHPQPAVCIFFTDCKGPFTSRDCDVVGTSLPNLIYCFGVVLLHWTFATATNFAVSRESLCIWVLRRSNVADASLSLDVNIHLCRCDVTSQVQGDVTPQVHMYRMTSHRRYRGTSHRRYTCTGWRHIASQGNVTSQAQDGRVKFWRLPVNSINLIEFLTQINKKPCFQECVCCGYFLTVKSVSVSSFCA